MAEPRTIEQGSLLIASASPFPPFAVERDGTDSGFDAELTRAVCGQLGLRWRLLRFEGDDFGRIFDGLRTGDHDAVAAAVTVTEERANVALFSDPYLVVDQALLVNRVETPEVQHRGDLATLVVGVERGRSSEARADELLEAGRVRDVRRYPCGGLVAAVDDLDAGRLDAILTLAPVAEWFARERESLTVVETIETREPLGIACAPGNVTLRDAVNDALDRFRRDGLLERLERRWMHDGGSGHT